MTWIRLAQLPRRTRYPSQVGSRWKSRLHPRTGSYASDGWTLVEPSLRNRMVAAADKRVGAATQGAARRISRRTFLEKTAEAGFATGLTLSGVLWGAGPAEAHEPDCGSCNCLVNGNDQNGGACGPAPPCNAAQCLSGGRCNLSHSGVRRRVNASTSHWFGNACGGSADHHCWLECCPGGYFRCCDCCVDSCAACTNSCTSCTSKKKCTCESNTGSCP
jgi:hypothetical protein